MKQRKIAQLASLLLVFWLSGCIGQGQVYVDPYGVEMVFVPAGEFTMGAEDVQLMDMSNAWPLQAVYVESFYIDKYEVSNANYQKCVDAGICRPNIYPTSWQIYYPEQEAIADLPVTFLSWEDAKTYCAWRGARLPTEPEWEKAARGTDGRIYPWGNEIDCSYANYGLFSCSDGSLRPVGSYPKGISPYGAYNMAGNAGEWVSNCKTDDHGVFRCESVLRGGIAMYQAWAIRTFERELQPTPNAWTGVRCAKSP